MRIESDVSSRPHVGEYDSDLSGLREDQPRLVEYVPPRKRLILVMPFGSGRRLRGLIVVVKISGGV